MEIHLRDDDVSPPLPNRLAGPAAAALRRNTGALALAEHDAFLRALPSIARSYNTSLRDLAVAPRPPNIGIKIVPEKGAVIVERFGKFHTVLNPGIHLLVPVVDQIAYVWHLKEEAIHVANQTAVTKDNVAITIDGVLYLRVVDPVKASYGVENPIYAVSQLAQTTMRSEIGKISLDKTFEERDHLNHRIVNTINEAATEWGLECLRYEIRDIVPPTGIKVAMEMQAEAERRKRATVLESEAEREAAVNRAEGQKQKTVLEAEAEAESTMLRARAAAESLAVVGEQLINPGGADAARIRVAELYLREFGKIAKEGNTVLLPADAANPANMVAQAMAAAGVTAQAIPGYEGGAAKVIAGGARTKTKAAASKAIGGASSGDAAIAKAAKKIEELAGSADRANRTILSELVGARSKAEKRAILSSN